MGIPVKGNVEVSLRKDLYDQHGLKPPQTWDELLANATKLNAPPGVYGFVHRDDRDSALADFANYMFSFGGDIFANASAGDYGVVFNSPANKRALEFYLALGKAGGYPSPIGRPGTLSSHANARRAKVGSSEAGRSSTIEQVGGVGKFEVTLIREARRQQASRAGPDRPPIARKYRASGTRALRSSLFQPISPAGVHALGAVPVRRFGARLAKHPTFRFIKARPTMRSRAMYAVVPRRRKWHRSCPAAERMHLAGRRRGNLNHGAAEVHEDGEGRHKTGRRGLKERPPGRSQALAPHRGRRAAQRGPTMSAAGPLPRRSSPGGRRAAQGGQQGSSRAGANPAHAP